MYSNDLGIIGGCGRKWVGNKCMKQEENGITLNSEFQEFTRKQGVSVAKTSIHILFDAIGSQVCL